jgi:drug/metabolite transporter (DMT)-like permease
VLYAIWLMIGSAFGLACGFIAIRRNRTGSGWFLTGLVLGPIALAVVLTRSYRDGPAFL